MRYQVGLDEFLVEFEFSVKVAMMCCVSLAEHAKQPEARTVRSMGLPVNEVEEERAGEVV